MADSTCKMLCTSQRSQPAAIFLWNIENCVLQFLNPYYLLTVDFIQLFSPHVETHVYPAKSKCVFAPGLQERGRIILTAWPVVLGPGESPDIRSASRQRPWTWIATEESCLKKQIPVIYLCL